MLPFGGVTLRDLPFSRLGLVLAWLALVAAPLPIREFMPPDEPRFAHQAQQMRDTGDWIVPRVAGTPLLNKPPLLFWGMNAAALPFGRITEVAARVPSALAALVVLLLGARLGMRLWGSRAVAFGGTLIALTGVEMMQKAQWASCDMLLTAFVWVAVILWREALFEPPTGVAPGLRIALGWLAVGFGLLAKGPVAAVWPVLWIVAESLVRRRPRSLLAILGSPGLPLAIAVGAVWLAAVAERMGWEWVLDGVTRETVTRYVEGRETVGPWWYYLYQTPVDLLPWAAFLPLGVAAAVAGNATDERDRIATRTVALFAAIAFLFFSASDGKRGVYLLPMFPAVGPWIAAAFLRAGAPGAPRAIWRTAGLGFLIGVGVTVAAGAVVALASGRLAAMESPGTVAGALGMAGAALTLGAAAAIRRTSLGRPEAALAVTLGGVMVAAFLTVTAGGAAWSRAQGARPFAERVRETVPATAKLVVERAKFEQLLLYAGRGRVAAKRDEQFLAALTEGGCTHALMARERLDRLHAAPAIADLEVLYEGPISGEPYVVLGPKVRP